MPKERLLFTAALMAAGALARGAYGGEPIGSTAGQHDVPAAESGPENEDAAPEGIVSRASGRPDHPRTLEEIVKSGYLRVLTRNNDTSFFIYRGHRMGFDYELGKKLAQHLGIRVDMIITQNWADMVPELLKGEGDVIAAEVTVTDDRKKQVLFAEPWGKTQEVVVWKDGTPEVKDAEGLSGKDVHVRESSSYYRTLLALNEKLKAAGKAVVNIKPVAEDWETDTILQAVSQGAMSYTIADDLLANIHTAYWENLILGPPISDERALAWAVRPGQVKLKQAIDDVFHELRKQPDFNWRLVAAQIYQESRFEPHRKSWVGALGLFQIMPATAKGLGITDPTDPEQSIRGGLKYMHQLSDHYQNVPDAIERFRFALAAYNSGFGHVDDARKLARAAKKDATRWREVAPFLLKLSDHKYAQQARFGFCRGIEPVDYVRHIDERYTGYAQLVPLKKEARGQ